MNNDKLKNYISGRRCEILGLGVSNLPLARKICDMGETLTVKDKAPLSALGDDARALADAGVSFVCGDGAFERCDGDLIFRSPGIRPDIACIADAVARGAELSGEIELFLGLCEAKTFGITGSDGKTTSTTLTYRFLEADSKRTDSGKAYVGGNIGSPLLDRLSGIEKDDRVAIELSSFQLMTTRTAPTHAAITNISPNHLDWHRGMDEYVSAKLNIIGENTRRFVTNADCPTTAEIARKMILGKRDNETSPEVWLFSSSLDSFCDIFSEGAGKGDRAVYVKDGYITVSDGANEERVLAISQIRVPGRHNIENFMTAIALTYAEVDVSVYSEVASDFRGVEHRLEHIRTLDGVDYYNSSIDSSPTRTAAALSALRGRDIVIICGGYDKKIPFEPLAQALIGTVRAVVLTGATADKIEAAILSHKDYMAGEPEIRKIPSFSEAVTEARALARAGGCVLLSPACASFDAFKNFAERGKTFCNIVNNF